MITYFYWFLVFSLMAATIFIGAYKMQHWKKALIGAAIILFIGIIAYYFHFEQIFVKRFGGVMTISIPAGQVHLASTWKGDNLWIEKDRKSVV